MSWRNPYHGTSRRASETSGWCPTAQIYSPPYLFKGPRPTIGNAPKSVRFEERFAVSTPDAAAIGKVTWLRLGSVTYAFDQSQSFERLDCSGGADDTCTPAGARHLLGCCTACAAAAEEVRRITSEFAQAGLAGAAPQELRRAAAELRRRLRRALPAGPWRPALIVPWRLLTDRLVRGHGEGSRAEG